MATITKKKADGETAKKNDHITDIQHEVVDHSPNATKVEAQLITVEDQIKMELAKFNVADAAIAVLNEQYGGLSITGPEDKLGYDAVKKAWNDVRSRRTGLEKKGKELRSGYQVITKAIGAEEDRLIELISPLEEDLYKKWKAIDDEKERVKKEKEEEEQRQLMKRVEEIQTLGMSFSDGFYQIGGTISVDVASLRGFNEEQYEKLKSAITAKKAEMDKAAEEKAEQDRLEKQRQDEAAAELKRQQDELKRQQDELRQQQEQLDQQKRDADKLKRELRANKIMALGMSYQPHKGTFLFDNGFRSVENDAENLYSLDEYGFDEHLKIIAEHIAESKKDKAAHDEQVKQETEEKERREKFIAESLESVGMRFNYNRKVFVFATEELDPIEATWNDFAGLDDAAIAKKANELWAMIEAQKNLIAQLEKERQSERNRQTAEQKEAADREAKLSLGDKERWDLEITGIEKAILKMVPGEFKTKKYREQSLQLLKSLTDILIEYK